MGVFVFRAARRTTVVVHADQGVPDAFVERAAQKGLHPPRDTCAAADDRVCLEAPHARADREFEEPAVDLAVVLGILGGDGDDELRRGH